MTLQSLLLVLGAWRNDRQIERNMGVAAAEVLDAGPRRSTIEFVTPDRITYRPELGVLYPSELDTGMRIYVEYDKNNPDLVRVQDRNAALAIIPAGSIAVVGWLVAGAALVGLAYVERRRSASPFAQTTLRRERASRIAISSISALRAPEFWSTGDARARSGRRHELGQPVVVVDVEDLVGRRVVYRWGTGV